MADNSAAKGGAQEGQTPKPRYSSPFSIDSLLSSSRPSSRPSSPAASGSSLSDAAVVTSSSVSTPQGHYHHQISHPGATATQQYTCPAMQSSPTGGAFHLSLPKVLELHQSSRSLPQKRPRQEETSTTSSTTSSSPSGSDLSSPEYRRAKRAHLEEGARHTPSPLEEEEDDLHRDSPSPTDSSSGSSGSPNSDAPSSGVRRKKNRTSFTPDQISQLEANFLHHRYLAAPERTRLARRLELSEQQIKTWFQNRRMKEKRQVKDGDQPSSFHLSPSSSSILTSPSGLIMSPGGTPHMTSHMTSHPMAAASSPSSSFCMHMSGGSPPLMHTGHMFASPAHHFPGYPAPHHVHTGAHNMPLPPLYHHQGHMGMPEYSRDFMRPYHAMTMPVML